MALGDLRVNGSEFIPSERTGKPVPICRLIVIAIAIAILLLILLSAPGHSFGYTLFEEHFDDTDFASRNWYDESSSPTLTTDAYDGSYALQCYLPTSNTNCDVMGDLGRHLFTETNKVYLSAWVKLSSNWEGSGQTYHPHLFLFTTNMDTDYAGPSTSHLTTYVEFNSVTTDTIVARGNAQDSSNIDQSNVGVDLCSVTENRAANGCNGDCDSISTDCYGSSPNARNEKVLEGTGALFSKNSWQHIEAEFQLNSITSGTANADGVIRYWINGTQVINETGVMLRTGATPTMMFNRFHITPYIGDGSPVDQTLLIDNVVVGTERPTGDEYYVAADGVASWPTCTSIDTACSATDAMDNVVAGDTVYFREGDYYPDGGSDMSFPIWYPHSAGTSTQPITIRNYPGETPVIYQPLGANSNGGLGAAFYGYIVFDGFKFIKRKTLLETYLWHCYETANITIKNSEFVGLEAQDAHNHVGVANVHCDNLTVENNYFHDFTSSGAPQSNIGATWFFSTDGVTAYNNTFINCDNGIQTKLDQDNIEAYNNFFYNVYQPFHWQTSSANSGFSLHHNVAILPADGTFMYAADPAGSMTNFDIYNNSVYCVGTCRGIFFGNSSSTNVQTWNNIIYGAAGTTTGQDWYGDPDITYTDYNNYYSAGSLSWRLLSNTYSTLGDWQTASSFDSNATTTDPLFSNPSGTAPEDYKRQSYPSDGRGGSYDAVMGAYQDGTEVIGYQASGMESSPTGTLIVTAAAMNGSNSCATPIVYGENSACTVTPDAHYIVTSVTSSPCSNNWSSGNSYSLTALTSDCTTTALTSLETFTVTPSAGANGSLTPDTPQIVSYGSTTAFTVDPGPGYQISSVSGCGGSLVGNTFTTAAIVANCTVTASFILQSTAKRISELTSAIRRIDVLGIVRRIEEME